MWTIICEKARGFKRKLPAAIRTIFVGKCGTQREEMLRINSREKYNSLISTVVGANLRLIDYNKRKVFRNLFCYKKIHDIYIINCFYSIDTSSKN